MAPKNEPSILKQIIGMNGYDDSTLLPEGVVKLIQNMLPVKTALETRNGWAKYNSTVLPGSSGVFGLAPYSPTTAINLELAVSAGKLYSGASGTFTERYDGLSTNTLCQIVQFGDRALIVDQVNKMRVYKYGETTWEAGINSPKTYKLIDDFEAASGWTLANGTATNNTVNFIYGTQCITFLTTAGAVMTAKKSFTAKNLTIFDDGSSSGTSDYISIFIIRGVYANFDSFKLLLGNTDLSAYYTITISGLSDWTATSAPDVAFEFKIRKSAFAIGAGAPDWAAIAAVQLTIDAAAGLQAQIIADYLRLEKAGPTTADSGVAGYPDGTYYYRVTFVTVDGWESDPSVISDAVTVTTNKISLTNIPVPGSTRIASKKIYRLGGTSAEWRLLTILYDRTTTSYTDNIKDINLGDIQEIIEGEPYIPKCIAIHDKAVILANLTTADGTAYPCGVMVSQEESNDIYDHDNFFEIESNLGGKICWIISALDFIVVGKSDSIWKFDPMDLTIPPRNLTRAYGGVGPLTVCEGDNMLYFLDGAKKVISFNGSYFEDIGVANQSRPSAIQNYLDLIPDAYLQNCWMRYFNNFLLIGIPQTGDTYPTLTLAFYVPKQMWLVLSGWPSRCGYSTKISGANTLHLGHASLGYVYNGFSGDTDDGTDITSIIQTADKDFGNPDVRKDYAKSYLYGKKLTSTDVTLTIEPYLDTVDSTKDISKIINSTTHKKFEIPMPDMTKNGTFLGMRITATKRWAFRMLTEYARMIGVPL